MGLVTDYELEAKKEFDQEHYKEQWIEMAEKYSLRDKKNYQVLWSAEGSYQIYPDIPKFGPSDGPIFTYNLIYKTNHNFGNQPEAEAQAVDEEEQCSAILTMPEDIKVHDGEEKDIDQYIDSKNDDE